jgi:alpha-tubulin suppressor-like RCC1 family protein
MCGITLGGSTLCWGYADRGSLGNGTSGALFSAQTTPVAVSVPGGVAFAAMANASLGKCARSTTNEVFCWGDNRQYSLGTGSNTPDQSLLPVRIKSQGLNRAMP